MSVASNLGRYNHFSEFNSPLVTAEGVLTPEERKLLAMGNLSGDFTTSAGTVTTTATTSVEHFKDASGMRTSVFTLTAFAMGNGGDGADLAIGKKFFTFPAGDIWFEHAAFYGTFATAIAYTNALDAGIGSVIGSGVVSVLGGTAEFEDFVGGNTSAVLPAATVTGVTGLAAAAGIGSRKIASGDVHDMFLNAAGTWTNVASAGAFTFTGTIIVKWRLLA